MDPKLNKIQLRRTRSRKTLTASSCSCSPSFYLHNDNNRLTTQLQLQIVGNPQTSCLGGGNGSFPVPDFTRKPHNNEILLIIFSTRNNHLSLLSVFSRYWLKTRLIHCFFFPNAETEKKKKRCVVVAFVQLYPSVIGWSLRHSTLPNDAIGPDDHTPRPTSPFTQIPNYGLPNSRVWENICRGKKEQGHSVVTAHEETLAPVKMADVVQPDPNSLQIPGDDLSAPASPATARNDCSITPLTPSPSPRVEVRPRMACPFSVVVAIDFGTTSSGYAFSFTQDSEAIHMMKRWEGGDPGVANQKSPTCLLLTPDLRFHSFGFAARDFYHDLDPEEARHWLYFDKFKMKIHSTSDLTMETELEAVNGRRVRAIEVFAHALHFFREHALKEVKDQSSSVLEGEEIRWVITVPAVWRQPAKQFMREAAYLAGLVSPDCPEQLLIALEPEAASIYCRKLRLHQVIDLSMQPITNGLDLDGSRPFDSSFRQAREQLRRSRHSRTFLVESGTGELWSELQTGDRYIVADCGGGTVDLTVHQIEQPQGTLKELYKASGGPYGAVGVDLAFEAMLCQIFGEDFIQSFKAKRPAAWVDLTIAFEARKRTAAPGRANALNISLPFSFIDYYKRHRGQSVEAALRRGNMNIVKWSSQGMLRLTQEAMNELFQPTIVNIVKHIEELMAKPEVHGVRFLFLVGGFAESPMLQKAVQKALGRTCRIIIPHDVGLTILKGAVLFGLDPTVVRVRRCPLTYGVGVLNRFVEGRHPRDKLLIKDGREWCTDILDRFVSVDQSVALGEVVRRSYTPARLGQRKIIINIYCSVTDDVTYISDPGVRKCGTITLDLPEPLPLPGAVGGAGGGAPERREIRTTMQFGDTEIKVTAVDIMSNRSVRASIDFLSN